MPQKIAEPVTDEFDEEDKPLIRILKNGKELNRMTLKEFLDQEKHTEVEHSLFHWEPYEATKNQVF